MKENPSCKEQLTEIRKLLHESKEILDTMHQVLEVLYEVSMRILTVTERDDAIFARFDQLDRQDKSSLISSKSPPGFYLETVLSELKEIDDEGSV